MIDYNDIESKEDYYIVNKAMLTGISLVPIGADMDTKIVLKNAIEPQENENPTEEPKKSKIDVLFYI